MRNLWFGLAFLLLISGFAVAQQGSPVPFRPVGPLSWTPADGSGAGLTFSTAIGNYIVYGNIVILYGEVIYPSTVNASQGSVQGFPITVANQDFAQLCSINYTNQGTSFQFVSAKNTTKGFFYTPAGAILANSSLSLKQVNFQCIYPRV